MRTEREQSGTWRATNGNGAYLVGYGTRALAMAAGTREWLGFQHGHEIRASDPEPVDVFAPLRWTLENAQRIDRDLRSAGVDVAENAKERCEEQARAMLAEVARLREELRRATMTPRCSSGTPRAKVTASPTSSTPAPACWGMSRSRRRGQR